jgi:PBP1b-binding outer membrane lipoprotein LpoB
MNKNIMLAVIALVLLVSGCASVPMASLEADKNAKQFIADSNKANIYLYRNESMGGVIAMPVALDGRIAGKTASKTYFYWSVEPGEHEIRSLTENTARIKINAKAGQNHYIWQEVKMGMWNARSELHEVSEEKGKKAVNDCKLIEPEI